MEVLMRDLYCYECSLQFDNKYVFDVHLSVVHGEELDIKQEPDSQPLVIPEAKEIEIKQPDEEKNWENVSKRRKISIRTTSDHEEKEKYKCDICNANFGQKSNFRTHVTTVHEGKKTFKCDICDASFGEKGTLKRHVATVHEGKKEFIKALIIQ